MNRNKTEEQILNNSRPSTSQQKHVSRRDNELLWRQFCRLGEMMGDGLHYEPDGKWIAKEYRKLSKILIPELKEENAIKRKMKNAIIDTQMEKLLKSRKCDCGGELKQKMSGSKTAYCQSCNARYIARTK